MDGATRESQLFIAVVVQAFKDATNPIPRSSKSKKGTRTRERDVARNWLLSQSRDFHTVCQHAGLDPAYVYKRARAIADAGWEPLPLPAAA